jgi:hypothetical protein
VRSPIIAGKVNLRLVNGKGMKWDAMPRLLAEKGFYIDNWPQETKFPGNYSTTMGEKRGLRMLTSDEKMAMLRALRDPLHPLQFKAVDTARSYMFISLQICIKYLTDRTET